ncbi:MAG: ChaN family lipoprotein [Roseobacter sp.]
MMRTTLYFLAMGAALLAAPFAFAAPPQAARDADVVFLGELHDNPHHHQTQAEWVAALAPSALVFEMLTPEAAARITPENRTTEASLGGVLEWENSGWPDFAMYFPIFEAGADAQIYGAAIPSETLRPIMSGELSVAFAPEDIQLFALSQPLPPAQMTRRLALQARAHCDALPEDLLPGMIAVQRARDAALADAALQALEKTGGPVAVITGNGHARRDWGAPAAVAIADPSVGVFAIGQTEEGGTIEGTFDAILDAPTVDRGDPCAIFKK